jgi:CRP-like cAMP-binding protein
MKEDLRRLKDEAAELLQKGRHEKALKTYQKILELNPADTSALNMTANLLRRLGRRQEAAVQLEKLAEVFFKDGLFLRAVAACKAVLEFDPQNAAVREKLERLCRQEKAPSEVRASGVCSEAGAPAAEPEEDLPLLEPQIEIELESPAAEPEFEIEITTPLEALKSAAAEAQSGQPAAPAELGGQQEPQPPRQDLPRIPLFSELPPEALKALLERMRLITLAPGDFVVREGARGDSMFLVASGQVRVLKERDKKHLMQLAVLEAGSFFGEIALLRGGKRAASVQATRPTQLFEINRELWQEIAWQFPAVKNVLDKFMTQRLLRNVMNISPLFQPFSPPERVKLIERFVQRQLQPGEVVVRQGEESPGLFVVLHGKLEVFYTMEDGKQLVVGELEEGEVFGEISCLRKTGSTASVRAAGEAAVLRLPREEFDQMVINHPQILEIIDQMGEEHLARTLNTLAASGVLL